MPHKYATELQMAFHHTHGGAIIICNPESGSGLLGEGIFHEINSAH